MRCLHCREPNFEWAKRCSHCGVPIQPSVLSVRPVPYQPFETWAATAASVSTVSPRRIPYCACFEPIPNGPLKCTFHQDQQDTEAEGWRQLLELVERAARSGVEEFAPFWDLTEEAISQIVTLPSSIATLKTVRRLILRGSFLVRIPPEIGDMDNLVEFDTYMSDRLHWFPYEITRCRKLDTSLVSTRALYGNYILRPPFPQLDAPIDSTSGTNLNHLSLERPGTTAITACSVCRRSFANRRLHQVWISLNVGMDVLPLLVNACSDECVKRLPKGAGGYIPDPHNGGTLLEQPPRSFVRPGSRTR